MHHKHIISLIFLGLLGCKDDEPSQTTPPAPITDAAPQDAADLEPDAGAPSECEIGQTRCDEDLRLISCDAKGWGEPLDCPEGEVCLEDACGVPPVCLPSDARCATPQALEICNERGDGWELIPCGNACREGRGGVATCDDVICVPNQRACNGDQTVVQCTGDGTQFEFVERCNGGRTGKQCDRGECVPLCVLSEKVKTNVGCDYWAVDLDNAFVESYRNGEQVFLDAAAAPFAVVVSNPHPEYTAEVSVFNNEGIVQSQLVPPLGLHVFNLPRRDVDGTTVVPHAYRVRSSIPIVAYQFNPLENEDVFSNDASLLLPSHVLGDHYLVMTREQSFDNLRGYFSVVGINEEPTQVQVIVTANTQAGAVGNIPAMRAGDTFEIMLSQFDVLNIQTRSPGADLTGTRVIANRDVVVFGGSEAANAPNTNHCVDIQQNTLEGVCEYDRSVTCRSNYDCNDARLNTCCADHLEQQLFPIDTLGRHYIGTKSYDRGLEADYWRILATEDDTKVETIPPQVEIPTLNAGEHFEFGSREHFELISDKPVLVGQFLAAEQAPEPNRHNREEPGDAGTGDPAFILAVPVEQFRQDFVFLAPDKYAFDYVSVIAPVGANVFFDENVLPVPWEPVGDGAAWQVARFAIGDGVHFIQSDAPIAVIVYGYDQYVSYGYPGGLNLDVMEEEL